MSIGNESKRPQQSLTRSFVVAWAGIREGWRSDRNLRIHGLASMVVILLSAWLSLSAIEWGLLLLTCGLVWTAELVNSAIEAVVDLVSPEYRELARIAKDTASGAVLAAALTAVGVGVVILGPALWASLIAG